MSHGKMEEELTCPICMELFCQPRRLPCGHSYCHSCIASMLSKNAEESGSYLSFSRHLVCPECRDVISLDFVEGIEAIPLDFKLSKLVELFQFMKKSDDSDPDDASSSRRGVKPTKADQHSPSTGKLTSASSLNSLSSFQPSNQGNHRKETSPEFSSASTITPVLAIPCDISGDSSSAQATLSCPLEASISNFSSTSEERDASSINLQNLPPADLERGSEKLLYRSGRHNLNLDLPENSEPGAVNDIDESCLGAVGGVPLKETPITDSSRSRSTSHLGSLQQVKTRSDGCASSERLNEREVQYIASAFSPSISTTLPQSPHVPNSFEKFLSFNSYSELPTLDQRQVQARGGFTRAQSLPSEVAKADAREEEVGKHSNNERKTFKKKKRKGWQTLFRDDSSSSCSSDIEETESPPRPPVSQVKKGRLVTRFLKAIIFSDSSSSEWSDENVKETNSKRIRKKVYPNRKGTSEPTRRHELGISTQGDTQLINAEASSGNTSERRRANSSNNHPDTNVNESFSGSTTQNLRAEAKYLPTVDIVSDNVDCNALAPSNSNIEPKEIIPVQDSHAVVNSNIHRKERFLAENTLASIDSNTQPKEIVPADYSPTLVNSNTRQKELVDAKNTFASIDSDTRVKEEVPPASFTLSSNDISDSSKESTRRDIQSSEKSRDKNRLEQTCVTTTAEETKIRPLSTADRCSPLAPSHYDNYHNDATQVGMSELDLAASSHEAVNVPRSPLPVEQTFYDNMNSQGQPSNTRTLYDNISDSDLVHCRLEAEAALRRRHSVHNPPAEIEDLKTGFEHGQGTDTEGNSSGNRLNSQEDFCSIQRQAQCVDSPALMQEVPPQMFTSGPSPGAFEIADLKEDYTDCRRPRPQSMGNCFVANSTLQPSPLHPKSNQKEPLSLYDNVGKGSLVPKSPTVDEERIRPQCQSIPARPYCDQSIAGPLFENTPQIPVNQSQTDDSVDITSLRGACAVTSREAADAGGLVNPQDNFSNHRTNDNNNNIDAANETGNSFEEEDDINDEETDPGARMLQPKRKPRSKFRKFITSLLSLSSSSEDDEPYYTNNTSSSSKSSDW